MSDACDHERRHRPGQAGDVPTFRDDCRRPRRSTCRLCGHFLVLPCESSSSVKCEPCGRRYRRRVQVIALEGSGVDADVVMAGALDRCGEDVEHLADLAALVQERGPSTTVLGTFTAPGRRPHCKRAGCSDGRTCPHEKCLCTRDEGTDLAAWNADQGRRWNRFMQALRRSGLLGHDVAYFRAVEVQDGKRRGDANGRGALHEHVLFRVSTVLTEAQLRAILPALRRLAIAHGYGHEVDLGRAARSQDGRARLAAWYAAKYVAKATDERGLVPWRRKFLGLKHSTVEVVDQETGEVREVARVQERWSPWSYMTWTKCDGWGVTMKAVKQAQREWAQAVAGGDLLGVTTAGALSRPSPPPPPRSSRCRRGLAVGQARTTA